jgi:type I restriction enzyme R subunit
MNREDLASKFKDPKDPLQIVFLCAMWFTGFDVPHCSTLYLDKPMKNHTLMQTIARANRVYPGKSAGFIIDYVNIFKNLKKALSIYAVGRGDGRDEGEMPIYDIEKLVEQLREISNINQDFLKSLGISMDMVKQADVPHLVKILDDIVNAIVKNNNTKSEFISNYNSFSRLYKAVLPNTAAYEYADLAGILRAIARKLQSLMPEVNIDEIKGEVEELLDRSILPESYVIKDPEGQYKPIDISHINFDKFKQDFEKAKKHIEIERLRNAINQKIEEMILKNRTRIDWREKFENLIDEYNSGKIDMSSFFDQLLQFSQGLNEEDKRALEEGLGEEELAVYDLLTKPAVLLKEDEKQKVKEVAKRLLDRLKQSDLVIDWRYSEQNRARVKVAITEELERLPREVFTLDVFKQKCIAIYNHIYDSYFGSGKSVYALN